MTVLGGGGRDMELQPIHRGEASRSGKVPLPRWWPQTHAHPERSGNPRHERRSAELSTSPVLRPQKAVISLVGAPPDQPARSWLDIGGRSCYLVRAAGGGPAHQHERATARI
jgi:hypothetical protein